MHLDASAGRCQSRALHLDARCSSMQSQRHLDADADATLYSHERPLRKQIFNSYAPFLSVSTRAEDHYAPFLSNNNRKQQQETTTGNNDIPGYPRISKMLGYPGISWDILYNTTMSTPLIVVRRVFQGVVDHLHPELLGLAVLYSDPRDSQVYSST